MTLDAAYDNRAAVPDHAAFSARWRERSVRRRRADSRARLDLRYGAAPRATLDLFMADEPGVPTIAFFHGGYWQWNAKEDFAFVADGLLAVPLHVAVVGYSLAPDASLDDICAEARAAVGWLAEDLDDRGAARATIVAGGWSAGGHLAAIAAEDPRVRCGFALSGLFDLTPLLRTSLNDVLLLDERQAERCSPLLRPLPATPFAVAVGGDELPALRAQSEGFAARRTAAGLPGSFVSYPGLHHYAILDALGDPASDVVAGIAELCAAS